MQKRRTSKKEVRLFYYSAWKLNTKARDKDTGLAEELRVSTQKISTMRYIVQKNGRIGG